MSRCWDCGEPIVAADDDARVCCQCGGRNRRLRRQAFWRGFLEGLALYPPIIQWWRKRKADQQDESHE